METIINKYRPKNFKEVVGQGPTIKSIRAVLEKKTAHAFLFEGPAGTGKTTLARIIATKLGTASRNIVEVDAATNTGIDAMRQITEGMQFSALGENPTRFYILDEAHMLSKQAWTSLLKSVEEPPAHVYWAFCTTESLKIPKAIRTRCCQYRLQSVGKEEIFELLKRVIKQEKLGTSEDVAYLIAEKCEGSPRQALSNLAICSHCESRKEAAALLRAADEEAEVNQLCQAILKGYGFAKTAKIVKALGEINAESIRHQVLGYFTKVALDVKSDKQAGFICDVLEAFADPYPPNSTMYPVLISLGRIFL